LEIYRRFDPGDDQKFNGKHCDDTSDLWKIFDLLKVVRNLILIFIKYSAKVSKEGRSIVNEYSAS